jgi:perosamine synthetase
MSEYGDTRYVPMPNKLLEPVHGPAFPVSGLVRSRLRRRSSVQDLVRGALGTEMEVTLVDSGTSALYLALMTAQVDSGDDVVISTFNCPQVIDAVCRTGARPVLSDVDSRTGVATIADVEAVLTERTKAVVLTHQFGRLENSTVLLADWLMERGIVVVDDAAQAFGCALGLRRAGTLGHFGVLSFGPSKPINGGGGGALVGVERSAALEKPRSGTTGWLTAGAHAVRSAGRRQPAARSVIYSDVKVALDQKPVVVGPPTRMAGWNRRVLGNQLGRLERIEADRRGRLKVLADVVAGSGPELISCGTGSNAAAAWFRVPAVDRFALGAHLSAHGFQCSWYHLPLHHIERYREFAARPYPGADSLWPVLLQVPVRYVSKARIRRIGSLIRSFYAAP